MNKRVVPIVVVISIMCAILSACANRDIKEQIRELWGTEDGQEFFEKHSTKDMENVILFLKDPIRYFSRIRNIEDLFSYIGTYDAFMITSKRLNRGTFDLFLRTHFQTADEKKASILIFMVLAPRGGYFKELLTDKFTKLFESHYYVFINILKKMPNWKLVVDEVGSGDWAAFKAGLEKLGDSAFEKEFKEYVLAPIDEEGRRIIKKDKDGRAD
jgi:hypothetical protein